MMAIARHHLQVVCDRFDNAERLTQVVNQIVYAVRVLLLLSKFRVFFGVPARG